MDLTQEQHNFVTASLYPDCGQQIKNVILLGKAGVGKSAAVRELAERAIQNKIPFVFLAPTGIAAINIGGITIHRFLGQLSRNELTFVPAFVLIDECSMLRCDLFDELDGMLSRLPNKPRYVLVGDCAQLPPVANDIDREALKANNYQSPWFFSAEAFGSAPWEYHEFTKIFRQSDERYISLLEDIRSGNAARAVEFLNQARKIDKPKGVVLVTKNALAQKVNNHKLNRLGTTISEFCASYEGHWDRGERPNDTSVFLAKGARAMCVKNIYDDMSDEPVLVNGDIGTIEEISGKTVLFRADRTGERYALQKEHGNWIREEYQRVQIWNDERKELEWKFEKVVTGRFTQIPLRLAWATTVHKSQGQSFAEYTIHVSPEGRFFDNGQAYVALSRGTNLEGLWIHGDLTERDIRVCPIMQNFLDEKAGCRYIGKRGSLL